MTLPKHRSLNFVMDIKSASADILSDGGWESHSVTHAMTDVVSQYPKAEKRDPTAAEDNRSGRVRDRLPSRYSSLNLERHPRLPHLMKALDKLRTWQRWTPG